jgi:hypothetical protein
VVDGWIILKCISMKKDMRAWTGFVWDTIGTLVNTVMKLCIISGNNYLTSLESFIFSTRNVLHGFSAVCLCHI